MSAKLQEAQPESELIEKELVAADQIHREREALMAASDENRRFQEFAPDIQGILEALAIDEPIGDPIRRESRYVLAEIEKLQEQYKPEQRRVPTG